MCVKNLSFLFCYMLLGINFSTAGLLRCYDTGNFTPNSTYGNDLDRILSSLPDNVSRNGGFYTTTNGQGSNKVHALALCRGDTSSDACSSCVGLRVQEIKASCTNRKEALLWEGDVFCLVRYANRSVFGNLELDPIQAGYNTLDVSDVISDETKFYQEWENLMDILVERASNGTSKLKFATGIAPVDMEIIYALLQCTPDISRNGCKVCLTRTVDEYQRCCGGKQGGYVLTPNCHFRWDLYSFFNSSNDTLYFSPPPSHRRSPAPSPPPSVTKRKDKEGLNQTLLIVTILVPIFMATLLIACIIIIIIQKREKTKQEEKDADRTTSIESSRFEFDYSTIKASTDNFSENNKLGHGGFGSVYKGRLYDGQHVAVKRLSLNSVQGDLEFKNEVLLMAKLHHRNLVRLLGFSSEGKERLLIYELLPNSSLNRLLFDPVKRLLLDWDKRYNIILGIARGILYLHEDSQYRIVHRDLKASNILLNEDMNPQIADFGLARLFSEDQSHYVTNKPAGTLGYMAPEYLRRGKFSVKSDVYSFGVLILEIIIGERISTKEGDDLLSHAWKSWKSGNIMNMIDPTLRNGSRTEIKRCIHLGLLCVQAIDANRPTMTTVVFKLSSYSMSLPFPSKPAFVDDSDTMQPRQPSINEVSISELDPR